MSIHCTNSGKYRVRYRDGGRAYSKTFTVREDAVLFERQVRRERETRGLERLDRGVKTLDELMVGWWEMNHHKWSRNTENQYKNLYQSHVSPRLGGLQVRMLEPLVLLEWRVTLERNGMSVATLNKAINVVSGILSYAVLAGELAANPMREVGRPQGARKAPPEPLSPAQVEIVRALMSERDKTLVSVLAYAGLRPNEALRLEWSDINTRTIKVRDTKRNRERHTILLEPLANDLRMWSLTCPSESKLFAGITWNNWRRDIWKPAFANAGLDGKNIPYRLRSSFVSLLLADPKYSIAQIAMYAGHSFDVMNKYYAGMIAEYAGQSVNVLDAINEARGNIQWMM